MSALGLMGGRLLPYRVVAMQNKCHIGQLPCREVAKQATLGEGIGLAERKTERIQKMCEGNTGGQRDSDKRDRQAYRYSNTAVRHSSQPRRVPSEDRLRGSGKVRISSSPVETREKLLGDATTCRRAAWLFWHSFTGQHRKSAWPPLSIGQESTLEM